MIKAAKEGNFRVVKELLEHNKFLVYDYDYVHRLEILLCMIDNLLIVTSDYLTLGCEKRVF